MSGEGFAVDASLIPADANKTRSIAAEDWSPEVAREAGNRAAREYLETLDDAAFGAASPTPAEVHGQVRPAAQWTRAEESRPYFAYATNYLIDTKSSVIMDVEATRAIRQAEVGASRTMLDRTEKRFGIRPEWLAADTAYGNAENLGWLVERRSIIPFIPVIDKSERTDGTFSRSDFEWDEKNDQYICPEGQALKQFRRNYSDPNRGQATGGRKKYRALKATCQVCPSKDICCPKAEARYVNPRAARGSTRVRPHMPQDQSLQDLTGQKEKGRDAIRSPEAHPEPHAAQASRTERRKGRIPPRRYRPEPPKTRQASPAVCPKGGQRMT